MLNVVIRLHRIQRLYDRIGGRGVHMINVSIQGCAIYTCTCLYMYMGEGMKTMITGKITGKQVATHWNNINPNNNTHP